MNKKVLLVDDKKEFRKLVKIYLSRKYDVETAENGLHALSILKNGFIPDLIVSDLMMPEVDGKTFLMQLRASGAYRNIPVIILSSIDKSSRKIELINNGADDYLIKPFNPEELETRIENLLKKKLP
jgi:DNA-binding response OmpR family regulator